MVLLAGSLGRRALKSFIISRRLDFTSRMREDWTGRREVYNGGREADSFYLLLS